MPRRLAAIVMTLLLTACGTSAPPQDESSPGSAPAGGPITVTDGSGASVTIPRPATRVVSLEWAETEHLLDLGVTPVGVADPQGYRTWVKTVPLPDGPVDVGLRSEPAIESIAKARPDLIIGVTESVPPAAMERLRKIAPVVLFKGADARRPMAHMRTKYTDVARLVGKEDVAARKLSAFDATLAAARKRLQSAAATPYAFTYMNVKGNTVSFRMHATGSLPGAVAGELGLKNAYAPAGDPVWGIGAADLEGLRTLPANTRLLSWANAGEPDPATGVLAQNSAWTSLPFVKAGQVHRVGDGVWLYGGPASMTAWIDILVRTLG